MPCYVSPEVLKICEDTAGAFKESISHVNRSVTAAEQLDVSVSAKRAANLERYVSMKGKKLLEIGAGFGTNLASWIIDFDIDGYAVEPGSSGFSESYNAAHRLFEENHLDPARIINASGENLPFDDASFDIVYSGNVLEHVNDPKRVLREALRVLRSGGVLHMEIPNFFSYLETHYWILQPPMLSKKLLSLYVRLLGRDPEFVSTLNLINPMWCKRTIRELSAEYPVELISMGEDIFLDRLANSFEFQLKSSSKKVGLIVSLIQRLNFGNWIGRMIVMVRGWHPILLTVRKLKSGE